MAIQYTKEDLRKAAVQARRTLKLQSIARQWAILPFILHNRLYNALPRSVTYKNQQRLTITQENHLANWIRI